MFASSGLAANSDFEYPIAAASCSGVNVLGPQQPPVAFVVLSVGEVEQEDALVPQQEMRGVSESGEIDGEFAGAIAGDQEPVWAIFEYPSRTMSRIASACVAGVEGLAELGGVAVVFPLGEQHEGSQQAVLVADLWAVVVEAVSGVAVD